MQPVDADVAGDEDFEGVRFEGVDVVLLIEATANFLRSKKNVSSRSQLNLRCLEQFGDDGDLAASVILASIRDEEIVMGRVVGHREKSLCVTCMQFSRVIHSFDEIISS